MRLVSVIACVVISCSPALASAVNTVALTIWGEARNQSFDGKHAVASTIWNRANGKSVNLSAVCKSRKQFSVWIRGKFTQPMPDLRKPADASAWVDCVTLADQMVKGTFLPSLRATHYHEASIRPYWAADSRLLARVGDHKFYK